MKGKIEYLIIKYKSRIKKKQHNIAIYEQTSRAGACIAEQSEINAYNAVISDLEKTLKTL